METTRRSLLNATRDLEGSIEDTMKTYSLKPILNDGAYLYGNTRISPKISGPYQDSKEIEISMCSDNFDVTEFENSYMHLDITLTVRFPYYPQGLDLTDAVTAALLRNQYVFVGLKCGSHVIRNYQFKFHDMPLSSTVQSSAVYESFLYSNFKAKGEIANKKFVFSPYDEVSTHDNSICGIYVSLYDIVQAAGAAMKLNFELIIPFRELLAMEAFQEYPNRLFGDIKIVFNTTTEGFVYCEVDPITSIEKACSSGRIDITNETLNPALSEVLKVNKNTLNYLRAFNQVGIGSNASFITGCANNNGSYEVQITQYEPTTKPDGTQVEGALGQFMVNVDSIITNECWIDVKGYKMSDTCYQKLREHFQNEAFVVPAQKVDVYTFPTGPNSTSFHATMNVRLNRVTDFEILMPTNSRQRTCFCNPALDNFQMLVGNWRAPDQLISTLSPEFFEQQMQNTDFDSLFEATDSFERSLTDARVTEEGYRMPVSDDTSFVPIFSCERANAESLVFDGFDYNSIKIELSGRPVYSSMGYNVYQSDDKDNCPPPILCCCCDTYWIFRIIDGYPNCQYITASRFEQAYEDSSLESVKAFSQ